MIKKIGIAIYVVVSIILVIGMIWGAFAVVSALYFDNSEMRPSKDHVTDYVSTYSRYAVRTLYDHNDNPIDIVIVDAKSGVSVAGIERDAYTYEISEVSSTLTFTLKDNEGVIMEVYNFDTKKGEWIK